MMSSISLYQIQSHTHIRAETHKLLIEHKLPLERYHHGCIWVRSKKPCATVTTMMTTPFPINVPPSLSKETSQTPLTPTCIETIEVVISCGAGGEPTRRSGVLMLAAAVAGSGGGSSTDAEDEGEKVIGWAVTIGAPAEMQLSR